MIDNAPPQSFSVRAADFEGPIDLLVCLIEKRKFFVGDVSLAAVADEYVEHIARQETFPAVETSQFLVVAATLMLIKSRALLPGLSLSLEEKHEVETLEARVSIYQKLRTIAIEVRKRYGVRPLYAPAQTAVSNALRFSPGASCTLDFFARSARLLIERLVRKDEESGVVIERTTSIRDAINFLRRRIEERLRASLTEFHGKGATKGDIVVHFLALLELIKQGLIVARQEGGDIVVENAVMTTPEYR